MPPFYQPFFLANSCLVSFCLSQVPTCSMMKPPHPPSSSCRRKPRPVVSRWWPWEYTSLHEDQNPVVISMICEDINRVFMDQHSWISIMGGSKSMNPHLIEEQYLRDEAFEHCAFVIWEWVTFKQQHENLSTSCINTINQPEIVMIYKLFDSLGYWRRLSLSATDPQRMIFQVGSAALATVSEFVPEHDRAELVSFHIVMLVYRKVHQFVFEAWLRIWKDHTFAAVLVDCISTYTHLLILYLDLCVKK